MAADELVVHGAREHNLKDIDVRLPRNALICVTGLSGSGQVLACLRHDLRGGAAALRRVALGLRAPVPPDDGEARRGLDRRALAGHLDRPEDDVTKPALHGGHGHGDLRLPAPALRADRQAALPRVRTPDRRAVGAADRRPGAPASRRDEVHGQRPGRARPQGRVQGRLRAPARRGLHAREGGRRAAPARGGDRARQEAQAHDRGRGRPARPEGGHPPPAHRLGRDGARARRPAGRDRRDRRQAADLLGALRVPVPRRRAARAGAAGVLVQLPARRLPALHGPRPPAGDRPGPARPRPDALDRGRRARTVVARLVVQLLRRGHRGDRRPLRDRPLAAVVRPDRRGAQPLPPRAPAARRST